MVFPRQPGASVHAHNTPQKRKPMKPRKSTIYDLANLAGVSPSTVSAVLSGTWRERRIGKETVLKVQSLADAQQYSPNRQASGLRTRSSGLSGMIIPQHDNRYFSEMAQVFEGLARERGWHPIVVGTRRDPALELETVRTLISYRVEHLLVVGATDPDSVSRLCQAHGVAHVNVDLPGSIAASVISDNYWGAQQLTEQLIERSNSMRSRRRNRLYFVGGLASDHATQRRMAAFKDTVQASFGEVLDVQLNPCGYDGDLAEACVRAIHEDLGGLPRALFINSTIALEGVVRFLSQLPADALAGCTFGCYDWDPFATYLRFPLLMVRQNVSGLLEQAFKIIDEDLMGAVPLIEIKPFLILPEAFNRSASDQH
jgi:LacI family fructose operon transcriptional repressor